MKNVVALKALDKANDGFFSKAEQKRVLDSLSKEYEKFEQKIRYAILDAANHSDYPKDVIDEDYWNVPMYLHQVRTKHFDMFANYIDVCEDLLNLIEARNVVKTTEIVKDVKEETKAEKVRKYVIKTLEERRAEFVEKLDLSRIIGTNVSVNAHYVTNQYGTTFLRYFFYLNGKLTALNTIICIAEKLELEEEES